MSITTADLCKSIVDTWQESGLNRTFISLWTTDYPNEFLVLYDAEAPGEQPFPYCVFGETISSTITRMSGKNGKKREIHDIVIRFNIHARDITSDARSAKEIGSYLSEEVMKVFGGHPTVSPTAVLTLSHGNHLITQYQNDYGVRTGDDEYQWIVDYLFKLDVPVAV